MTPRRPWPCPWCHRWFEDSIAHKRVCEARGNAEEDAYRRAEDHQEREREAS